ncbi:efflux RND transporter periplasmic adaptor subunit [Neptuniibacter sp. QD29_5]|uniref:efflux RND transporter periplasmic adaptor subunit n=1 Tax=Neptuniibacter sp. QD29_5 TaxID=3398207 RepID=UPI0039F4747C
MKYLLGCVVFFLSFNLSAASTVVVKPLSELLQMTLQSAPAQVINEEHATVSARLTASVEQVLIEVGQQVEQGQPLLNLECRDYELLQLQSISAHKSLLAQVRLAKQQLSRAERLLRQKNASKELRDQRKAELDSLVAQLDGAKARIAEADLAVERCIVLAPSDGVVTERLVSNGDLVTPGSLLVRVLSQDAQEVSAALSHRQVADMQLSNQIYFQFNGQRYPLSLRAVVPYMDNRARTQNVRFSFTQVKALSGSSGRVSWLEDKGRLPVQFVVSRNGELGLMKAENGKAAFVVLPEAIEGQAARVDLPLNTRVIIEGQHGVESGSDVIVMAQE